jgi:hypothetical protein
MKKILFLAAVVVLALSISSFAGVKGFGVGVELGQPTGLTLKDYISSDHAWDLGIAWAFYNGSYITVHADYLLHNFGIIRVKEGQCGLYFGIGAYVGIGNNWVGLGARIPLGINYIFRGTPVEVFLELVPSMSLFPATGFGPSGALGIRYYFR